MRPLVTVASFALVLLMLTGCSEETFFAYYSPGPIQAIGNAEELWVILEIDRQVARSHRAYDAPGIYPVGHYQELLILDADGLKERIRVKTQNNVDGVTFHPNISIIFADGNTMFLCSGESKNYQESLFRWNDEQKRFVLLPLSENNEIFGKRVTSASWGEREQEMDALSAKTGWSLHYSDRVVGDNHFSWNGIDFAISVAGGEEMFEITIDAIGGGD